MPLPTDRDARNGIPIWDGCIMYFPDTWAEIAKVSAAGNKQHALGGELRWERGISTDHRNKIIRHMLDDAAGIIKDTDDTYHLAKAAWRILAALQLRIEANAATVEKQRVTAMIEARQKEMADAVAAAEVSQDDCRRAMAALNTLSF